MKLNQNLVSKTKRVLLAATLTVGFLATNSLSNESQAKDKSDSVNRLWNGQCCPVCSLGNCGGY